MSLRVAIVGGGLGGLSAAIAMGQAGLDVHVYERASQLAEIGAGVALGPNAIRLLQRLGVGERVARVAAHPAGYELRRFDGRVYYETHSQGPLRTMRSQTVHRGQLLSALAAAVPADRVHTDHGCVSVGDDGDQATLGFAGGRSAQADVVVGADGIHSVVRERLHADAPVFSGEIAYRGLIPMDRLDAVGDVREHLTFWIGSRRHFLTFPVSGGELMNMVAFVPADGDWAVESWTAPGEVSALARQFEGWDAPVQTVIGGLDETSRWALYDRDPLPSWSLGRVTLLGDAAHAMLPHQGQGAVQSIEDAVVLSRCLQRAAHEPERLGDWLALYERIRRPRTGRVQDASRTAGEIYSLADTDEQERRVPSVLETRGQWLWNYDADEAFDRALADCDRLTA